MKLLIVAMPESVHTARWILQLLEQGWIIYLFPSSFYKEVHPLLRDRVDLKYSWLRFFGWRLKRGKLHVCGIVDFGWRSPFTGRRWGNLAIHLLFRFFKNIQSLHFSLVVRSFKPHVVHSLEFQLGGALCLKEKERASKFPKWIATNWGSDIFLFHRLPWATDLVKKILWSCDVYSCECQRDVELARSLGFKGRVWPVLPNSGGLRLDLVAKIRAGTEQLPRNLIMVKGYNSWSGRALFAIEALKRVANRLKPFKVVIFSWNEEVRIAMELAAQDYGISYELIPVCTPHEDILSLYARARIYLGAGISDGISTSCLEAMAMGAFPIQSKSACCTEWFEDGTSGLAVDGENIDEMAAALSRAIDDDLLCKNARVVNDEIISSRLNYEVVKAAAVQAYIDSFDNLDSITPRAVPADQL